MEIDIFSEVLVPVIGGLGIFLLGLEFMDSGIQALSANRMRRWLAKMAGSPAKGVMAGTIITGIIQSSTAMTVMTVGLVNAGVLTLRGAIGVVMGANVGTTLGNGLIAMPLGAIALMFGGVWGIVYCMSKTDKWKNIALAALGFSLVFYGLSLMTGGLKPLREIPAVMDVISSLDASTIVGVVTCALIAALITALIHSSSATIGIVMGLGASGVLEWQTAIAFAIGADLGTTITSWIASLNLSKNAKRTAYAHIAFNFIGVCVVLIMFFPAIAVLETVMGWTGRDIGQPVVVDGQETFPLVPLAVGLFSIFFNIFNLMIMFPFVNTFERVLSRIGRSDADDAEDYSVPRYINTAAADDFAKAVPAVQQEAARALAASSTFLDIARGGKAAQANKKTAKEPGNIYQQTDALSREIRAYSAHLFHEDLSRQQSDLVASLIEEVDFTASLTESLHQIARRVTREDFGEASTGVINRAIDRVEGALNTLIISNGDRPHSPIRPAEFEQLRWEVIDSGEISAGEKGAIIALLGSIERTEGLIDRIAEERASVDRDFAALEKSAAATKPSPRATGEPAPSIG